MQLELSSDEAQYLDDILGMWVEGVIQEAPTVATSDSEAHWSLYQLRRQREVAERLRLRINLERMQDGNANSGSL
jgi:hypothetical protein